MDTLATMNMSSNTAKVRGRADMVCEGDDDGIVFEFKFTSVPYKNNPFYPVLV